VVSLSAPRRLRDSLGGLGPAAQLHVVRERTVRVRMVRPLSGPRPVLAAMVDPAGQPAPGFARLGDGDCSCGGCRAVAG